VLLLVLVLEGLTNEEKTGGAVVDAEETLLVLLALGASTTVPLTSTPSTTFALPLAPRVQTSVSLRR